jgi:hypothetical protein
MSSTKLKKFKRVLVSARRALESIGIPFHLHAGTALGAHREKNFIKHDHDIDLAVFYEDVNTQSKVKKLVDAMEKEGFEVLEHLGTLKRGKEIQFSKNDVPLDIFWVYDGEYRGKKYSIISSYFGECDNLKYKRCVWGYREYKPVKIDFLGDEYLSVPIKTIIDMYGEDWETPKKFGYTEGITEGGYKGFIKDYDEPRNENIDKIAFCFLLYDTVNHRKLWEKFFNQDNYSIHSYNIYAHLKQETERTPDWIKENKIRSIKTGWCEESLVHAWIKLLKSALKDKTNKYFAILSGECIPLFTYNQVYKKITSTKKSRINPTKKVESYHETGLYYADQWVILNRKHARLLVNLTTTESGKKFLKELRERVQNYCPDELFPINWFIKHYGKPSSETFRKEFKIGPSTFTFWDETAGKPHPVKFSTPKMKKFRQKICKSSAIFGRKFNSKAARTLAMTCLDEE